MDCFFLRIPQFYHWILLDTWAQKIVQNEVEVRKMLSPAYFRWFCLPVILSWDLKNLVIVDMIFKGENSWLYKNKDHGMLSAAASVGMILMWDIEGGCQQLDKYMYSNEDYIKAGAMLGVGQFFPWTIFLFWILSFVLFLSGFYFVKRIF